jgi:hypothetical protein
MPETFFTIKARSAKEKVVIKIILHVVCFFIISAIFCNSLSASTIHQQSGKNTDQDKRALLNGRIWWNQYSKAIGNQYFLDGSNLRGSVVFNGKHYSDLDLRYDIANDELLFSLENHPVILLNKEMVDSFTLAFQDRTYIIFNAGNDTSAALKGYVNLLYRGPSSLYVKYSKKIYPLAVDGRFDLFAEEHQVFLKTTDGILLIKSKKKLFDIMKDQKKELNHFIRINKLRCSMKSPESFTPVLEYYDKLKQQ